MPDQKVVLITGASSGVGQSTARLLSQRGYKVFGTSRHPSRAEIIPGVETLPLDVRSDDSVRACVEAMTGRGGRLDVLINNAGLEMAGALEELSLDEARAQFETNFFGVSSLSGLSAIPFLGIYLRHLIGQQARSVARLRRFLPAGMYERGVRRTFSLEKTR
jgi:NAD(P)-dependent dehydrogenase (short-subunit alcohol dehydrogenase family)